MRLAINNIILLFLAYFTLVGHAAAAESALIVKILKQEHRFFDIKLTENKQMNLQYDVRPESLSTVIGVMRRLKVKDSNGEIFNTYTFEVFASADNTGAAVAGITSDLKFINEKSLDAYAKAGLAELFDTRKTSDLNYFFQGVIGYPLLIDQTENWQQPFKGDLTVLRRRSTVEGKGRFEKELHYAFEDNVVIRNYNIVHKKRDIPVFSDDLFEAVKLKEEREKPPQVENLMALSIRYTPLRLDQAPALSLYLSNLSLVQDFKYLNFDKVNLKFTSPKVQHHQTDFFMADLTFDKNNNLGGQITVHYGFKPADIDIMDIQDLPVTSCGAALSD